MIFDESLWESPKQIIQQSGLAPLQSLGQNFLVDRNTLKCIVEAIELDPNDAIVEIGPGTGVLTAQLVATGCPMMCIELDKGLASLLKNKFNSPSLQIVQGDVLATKTSLHPELLSFLSEQTSKGRKIRFVSNLPYQILTPLIWNLIELKNVEINGIFLVQREFAEKLTSAPGTKKYTPLGVVMTNYYEVRQLRKIGTKVFWPVPAVESALIRVRERENAEKCPQGYADFLKLLFSMRRKSLQNLLKKYFPDYDYLEFFQRHTLDSKVRSESLQHEQLLSLFHELRDEMK